MIKKITTQYLKKIEACQEGIDWVENYKDKETIAVLKHLIKDEKLDWVNWLICRIFNRKQKIQYAIYAAEQVIDIYEKKYPNDKRPRNAIEAAKKCLKNPSEKNKNAAYAAYTAAAAAVEAAAAAVEAAEAAYAVAYAAEAAVEAAEAAVEAAEAAGRKKPQLKILKYGLKLIDE